MKDKTILWAIGVILGLFILYSYNPGLFAVITPGTPDPSLQKNINQLYLPVSYKTTNLDKCSIPNVQIGSTFDPSTSKAPLSSDVIFIDGKYFKYKGSSSGKKDCISAYGSQVLISNSVPFANFILIKKDENNYYLCQNTKTGNKYYIFAYNKNSVSLRYTTPKTEQEGKYYCDGKNIYLLPCSNGKKVLMETCKLGCQKIQTKLDTANVEAIKCKGDYKPNTKVCSEDSSKLFTTDKNGILSTTSCCCKDGYCTASYNCAPKSKCQLISGDGNGQINIFVYGTEESTMKNWGKWMGQELLTESPYNEFTYNVYYETFQYDCNANGIRRSTKDFDAGWASWFTAIGLSDWWSYDTNHIWFNNLRARAGYFPNDRFLLLHELGHCYTSATHVDDGSIMDYRLGGDGKYRDYQRIAIRNKLSTGVSNLQLPQGVSFANY